MVFWDTGVKVRMGAIPPLEKWRALPPSPTPLTVRVNPQKSKIWCQNTKQHSKVQDS